jgi:hypothetical protein
MKRQLLAGTMAGILALSTATFKTAAQEVKNEVKDTAKVKVPFEGYDLSWINGQNRQTDFPLTLKDKDGETILTGMALVDGYFNYNFARPKDNTQTISASIGRSNEFAINQASFGIESNYKNVIGRFWFQTGNTLNIVQETDGSVYRGRNTSTGNLKFIREAAAGYHFNVNYGLNVEMGIFMSYIGLESYVLQENWSYQRSMVCDFTPFYFQGARLQYFPTRNLKTELWILNGWQTYNSFSKAPGLGSSTYYRPNDDLQLVANFYYGTDSRSGTPELSSVKRFHHDNSIVYRYFKNKESAGLSQAAFSLNSHYGFQSGEGVKAKTNYMTGSALSSRLWFNKNKLGWTMRADYVTNPGLYLAFSPAPAISDPATGAIIPNDFDNAIAAGSNLRITQLSTTFDYMPNQFMTFRLEYGHRSSNVPYFAGPGGTTSQTGFSNDTLDPNWKPDLRKYENRLTLSMNFRL